MTTVDARCAGASAPVEGALDSFAAGHRTSLKRQRQISLRLELSLLDQEPDAVGDRVRAGIHVAALARAEHVGDDPRDLQPVRLGEPLHHAVNGVLRRGPSLAARATILLIGGRHLRIDAAGRQAVEEVALDADVGVSPREGQRHDPQQHVLDRRMVVQRQRDPRLGRQGVPAVDARAHRHLDGAIDDRQRGLWFFLAIELLICKKDQRHRIARIGGDVGEMHRLGSRVVAAVLVLRRQQEAQVPQPRGVGFGANPLLERRNDVDVARAPTPFLVPANERLDRIETADGIRRLLASLRDVFLIEKTVQDLPSLGIGFLRDPVLDRANAGVAVAGETDRVPPLLELVEAFGVSHVGLKCSHPWLDMSRGALVS